MPTTLSRVSVPALWSDCGGCIEKAISTYYCIIPQRRLFLSILSGLSDMSGDSRQEPHAQRNASLCYALSFCYMCELDSSVPTFTFPCALAFIGASKSVWTPVIAHCDEKFSVLNCIVWLVPCKIGWSTCSSVSFIRLSHYRWHFLTTVWVYL